MKRTGKTKMVLKKATIANLKTEELKEIQAGVIVRDYLTARPPVCDEKFSTFE